jgi:hypothetical protein
MNYQDVTPDFLVYNATAGATDFVLANQIITAVVNGAGVAVKIPYLGIQSTNGGIISSVSPGTAAQWTIDTGASVANTTYSVNILQLIDGVAIERQISYTTPAIPVANDAAIGLNAIINKLLSVGTFEIASSTQLLNVVTVTSELTNATLLISAGQNVVVANSVPAVPPRGIGSTLSSIVDLNGVSPLAGSTYDSLTLDYQVDRIGLEGASRFQRKQLIILFRDGIANLAALQTAVGLVLAGTLDTSGASANIEQVALQ